MRYVPALNNGHRLVPGFFIVKVCGVYVTMYRAYGRGWVMFSRSLRTAFIQSAQ